jgi:hypothetical protein
MQMRIDLNTLTLPSQPSLAEQTSYFTYSPATSDTPDASPVDDHTSATSAPAPLRRLKMDASQLMSVQTTAAYNPRPNVFPVQPASSSNSTSSSSSSSSDSSSTAQSALPMRCSRCHRESNYGMPQMVAYGSNLWYCRRCAVLVGYPV